MARGLELAIATDPADMARLTDHDGWTLYLHQCMLPALDQGPDLLLPPGGHHHSCCHDHIIGYPDHAVQSTAYHLTGFSVPDHRSPGLAEHALMA